MASPVGPALVGADDDAGFDPPGRVGDDEPLPAGRDADGADGADALVVGAGRRGARGATVDRWPRFNTAAAPGFSVDVPAVNPQTFTALPPSGCADPGSARHTTCGAVEGRAETFAASSFACAPPGRFPPVLGDKRTEPPRDSPEACAVGGAIFAGSAVGRAPPVAAFASNADRCGPA